MSDNVTYRCTEVYGVKPPVKVRYWIEDRDDGCYVACEFSTMGPMERRDAEWFVARFSR